MQKTKGLNSAHRAAIVLAAAGIGGAAHAGQVWQATFDSTADGVVDIKNSNSAKAMIGPVSNGRLRIDTSDNFTNSYTPDKAGRPLGATLTGADSFSGLYKFSWSSLPTAEAPFNSGVESYEGGGFLGNATPQTRQICGFLMRHSYDANTGNYYLGLDLAFGSTGNTNSFGYWAGPHTTPYAVNIGSNALNKDYQLAIGWDGVNRVLHAALYDSNGNVLTDPDTPTLNLDIQAAANTFWRVGLPGGSSQAQVDAEIAQLSATHLGWEDYTGYALDSHHLWDVDTLTYYNDANGAFQAAVPAPIWIKDGDGNWSDPLNWAPSVPNAVGATAQFLSAATAPRTATLNVPVTIGHLVFNNNNAYTLGGANALTLQVASGNADITVALGTHNITAPLTIASNTNIAGSGTLTTGDITNSAALNIQTTVKAGNIDGAGSISVGAGKSLSAGHIRQASLSINGSAKVNSNGGTAGTSNVTTLTIAGATDAWTGKLDLTNNALVVDYPIAGPSPLATIVNQIKSGSASGSWSGNGITSSTSMADASTARKTALGYGEASDIYSGATFPVVFRGQSVDATSVLVRYTAAGDGNLDGTVDLTDFTFLASNFNGNGKTWLQGDFNYDGVVDLTDFTFLAANFNYSIPAGTLGAAVPEPVSFGTLVLLTAACQRRRKLVHRF